MATDYKTFLAANVLSDEKIITYRMLSRALKVHVNKAKQMLFEFHRIQSSRKPGSVYATYLLAGVQHEKQAPAVEKKDGDDTFMQSSPAQVEEPDEAAPIMTICLVTEDDLREVRSQFESISSVHVYSLGPSPLKDLQVLSDSGREMSELYKDRDPLEFNKIYGTVSNKNVRRRTGRRPPIPHAKPPLPVAQKPSSQTSSASSKAEKKDPTSASSTAVPEVKPTQKRPVPSNHPVPSLKKEPSSLFKAFAKAKPKLKREATDSSAVDSAASGVDEPMKGVSDDDEEETYVPPAQTTAKENDKDSVSRKEREAALRKMMEEDSDDQEPDLATPASEMVDEEAQEEKEGATVETPVEESAETAVTSNGRRRGRRRVMKKKTVKDKDGYLVTSQEPVWESFSEDEVIAVRPKTAASVSADTSKTKKTAGKPGQGSIMSFFGKKS